METVNIHQAKTHLSRLLEKVAKGEPFIIAKAGKPAQATSENITLLTSDSQIAKYPGPIRFV